MASDYFVSGRLLLDVQVAGCPIEQGLEDFSPCPERGVAEVSPTGVDTIKGNVDWWRHYGAGVWTPQEVATGKEVLIEHGDFPVQDHRGGRQRRDRRGQLSKPSSRVDAISAQQTDRSALLVRH